MERFQEYLDEAVRFHGHLCAGQVLGVRMSIMGMREIGINDPEAERKKMMVFVEIDRCATDAIMTVTGCKPGKRTMKIKDYGKMAATFINLETGKAVRIASRSSSREKSAEYVQDPGDESSIQCKAYMVMPDDELFEVKKVKVNLTPGDMPGRPVRRVTCDMCGESVMDARDILVNNKALCRPCAEKSNYYTLGSA
ncbi:MAG: FmdE family protein [Dissulfurispiraceae bacterium]|jgi:formylmethanofuran dehydrogenase subunit E|nr:FmdE family protein [Dissulfurispiraceae bacterium]